MPRFSGHIKIISWTSLVLEVLLHVVFGRSGVKRNRFTVLLRLKVGLSRVTKFE